MASRSIAAPAPVAAGGQVSTVDGLAQLSFLIHRVLERLAAERELSIVQTRLLGVLRDRTPSMTQLAQLLGLDKSSTTGLIDRAERRGLVQRSPSPADRRAVLVSLTDTGRSLASQVSARFEAEITTILECLSVSERAALSGLISRVLVVHASQRGVDLFAAVDGANA